MRRGARSDRDRFQPAPEFGGGGGKCYVPRPVVSQAAGQWYRGRRAGGRWYRRRRAGGIAGGGPVADGIAGGGSLGPVR